MHMMTFAMIENLYSEGYTMKQIAKMVGVSREDVERALFDEPIDSFLEPCYQLEAEPFLN